MKTAEELKPNFAPVYASAMYPDLAKIFHKHGYALAVHGSLARDLDLVAVPWADKISNHGEVLDEITKEFAVRVIGEPGQKNWGRVAYTISCGWGECSFDISFFPAYQREWQ